jgi:hypothetical protein
MSRRFRLRFLENYFRQRWLHVLPLVLLIAGGIFFWSKPVYVSRGAIYVQNKTLLDALIQIRTQDNVFYPGNKVPTPAEITANEFKELAQTDAFVYAVLSQSDLNDKLARGPKEAQAAVKLYRESLFVEAEGDSLVRLSVEAESPQRAHQLAANTIIAYRSWKVSKDSQESGLAREFFEELLKPYEQELQQARAELQAFLEANPEPLQGERPIEEELQIKELQSGVDLANERLKNVLAKEESARLALAQTNQDVDQTYKIVDSPQVPQITESLIYRAPYAAVFLVLGVLLSIISVTGSTLLNHSFLFPSDVVQELELPVLAQLQGAHRSARHNQLVKSDVFDRKPQTPTDEPLPRIA